MKKISNILMFLMRREMGKIKSHECERIILLPRPEVNWAYFDYIENRLCDN